MKRLAVVLALCLSSTAAAGQYPFEGRWAAQGEDCRYQAFTLTTTSYEDPAIDMFCEIGEVIGPADGRLFGLGMACRHDPTAEFYRGLGIQMMSDGSMVTTNTETKQQFRNVRCP